LDYTRGGMPVATESIDTFQIASIPNDQDTIPKGLGSL